MRLYNLLSEAILRRLKQRLVAYCQAALCFLLFLGTFLPQVLAQGPPEYESISVSLTIESIGETEMPAVIKDEQLYLSITSLFSFLSVDYSISRNLDSISGFIYRPQDQYLIILRSKHTISYLGKVFAPEPENFIHSDGLLYLKSNFFGEIFGLECAFNIRTLSVQLTSQSELPVIRALRMEQTKTKIHQLEEKFVPDRTIGRRLPGSFTSAPPELEHSQRAAGERTGLHQG